MSNIDPQAIPKAACTFQASEITFGDNGDNARTAPIRMLARSSKPIEHWFWGNVVHSTAGFNLAGKNRIPIDFDHDTAQAIGYINKFEETEEGLVLSGTLVSHYEGDRADKIMRDQRAGIPYESSINFGGDGIKIRNVGADETVTVNGFEFSDGVVIEEWPLRGVALTLYGADMYTDSKVFKDGGTVAASVIEPKTEEGDMPDPKELNAEAIEAVEAVDAAAEEVANPEQVEETTELSQAVEAVEVEAVEAVEAEAVEVEEDAEEQEMQFSTSEFQRMVTDFGAEVAAEVVSNGGTYSDALMLAYVKQAKELEDAKAKNAELSANPRTVSTAVAFADGELAKGKKMSFADALQARFDELKTRGLK